MWCFKAHVTNYLALKLHKYHMLGKIHCSLGRLSYFLKKTEMISVALSWVFSWINAHYQYNLYEPLESDGVEIPNMDENSPPLTIYETYQIYKKIKLIKKKVSSVPDDIREIMVRRKSTTKA